MVIDTEGDHNTQSTARRAAKMYQARCVKGRYVNAPTITELNAEHQRADDRRPDHRAQRLQPPFLPRHRQDLDR